MCECVCECVYECVCECVCVCVCVNAHSSDVSHIHIQNTRTYTSHSVRTDLKPRLEHLVRTGSAWTCRVLHVHLLVRVRRN